MESWWQGLTSLNQAFVVSAFFFSILFLFQLACAVLGMDGDSHGDASHPQWDHSGDSTDTHGDSNVVFTFLSIRSLIAFGTLFSWAGALYLREGTPLLETLACSLGWGVAAMFLVSFLLHKLMRLQERGNMTLWGALGEEGSVYINIPADGAGQVRIRVRGIVSHVKARSHGGEPLEAGVPVRVVAVIGANEVEVEATEIRKGD
jgi:hypothetical protein